MHLIDRDRCVQRVAARGRRRGPRDCLRINDDRCGLGPDLRGKRNRIGLERQQVAVRAQDLEFVLVSCAGCRHENFPEAVAAHAHGMAPAVPDIEIADDAHAPRVRREYGEGDARHAIERDRMRAELVIEPEMGALAQQIEIEIGQNRRKAIGVVQFDDRLPKCTRKR